MVLIFVMLQKGAYIILFHVAGESNYQREIDEGMEVII
jgi:hypothetical protein